MPVAIPLRVPSPSITAQTSSIEWAYNGEGGTDRTDLTFYNTTEFLTCLPYTLDATLNTKGTLLALYDADATYWEVQQYLAVVGSNVTQDFIFEWGRVRNVRNFILTFALETVYVAGVYPVNLTLSVSTDGINYTDIVTNGVTASTGAGNFNFYDMITGPQTFRYIRLRLNIVGSGNNQQSTFRFYQMRVYF